MYAFINIYTLYSSMYVIRDKLSQKVFTIIHISTKMTLMLDSMYCACKQFLTKKGCTMIYNLTS